MSLPSCVPFDVSLSLSSCLTHSPLFPSLLLQTTTSALHSYACQVANCKRDWLLPLASLSYSRWRDRRKKQEEELEDARGSAEGSTSCHCISGARAIDAKVSGKGEGERERESACEQRSRHASGRLVSWSDVVVAGRVAADGATSQSLISSSHPLPLPLVPGSCMHSKPAFLYFDSGIACIIDRREIESESTHLTDVQDERRGVRRGEREREAVERSSASDMQL